MLAETIFSVCYTLLARRLSQSYPGLLLSTVQAFIGCLVFLPLCLTQKLPGEISGQALFALAWPGLGIGLGAYFAYNWAMRWVSADIAGILCNLAPISGIFLAVIILGEQMRPAQSIFAAIVLLAIFRPGIDLRAD